MTAPRINKLVPVKPMTHTKINQVTARHKPPTQIILRHIFTGTKTVTIAAINRPTYSKKTKSVLFIFFDVKHTEYESQYKIIPQLAVPVDILNWSDLRKVKKNLENVVSFPRVKIIELINKIE